MSIFDIFQIGIYGQLQLKNPKQQNLNFIFNLSLMQQDSFSTQSCENEGATPVYLNQHSTLDVQPTICSLKHRYQITVVLQVLLSMREDTTQ